MKDETYAFVSDVKGRASVARSARNRRTHNGKGGKVRLPSDNLSKKEIMKMNGECKSYKLNGPMPWKEFKDLPDDIKIVYIKLLRQKFNVPFVEIGKMLGVSQKTISAEIIRLGLSEGKAAKGRPKKWDKEGFWAWANGVKQDPAPTEEETTETPAIEEEPAVISAEPETFVEDDLPFEEPDPIPCDDFAPVQIPATAIPCNGSMSFHCPANQALNTLLQLLGENTVSISVMWRVD